MWKELQADLARLVNIRQPRPPRLRDVPYLAMEQAAWATAVYRFGAWARNLPAPVRRPVLATYVVAHKLVEVTTGISVPGGAQIGEGFYIGHFGGIIVSPGARIGRNCNIGHGVTIGTLGMGKDGAPVLGDNVFVGAGAKILGPVTIGDGAVIGANAVVLKDVPPNSLAVGIPARILPRKDAVPSAAADEPKAAAG